MTPMEKAALSRQANDQHKTMSEYIRSIAKCPPEVTRDEFDGSILQMIYEINKIGVNINQIAKKYNEHKGAAGIQRLCPVYFPGQGGGKCFGGWKTTAGIPEAE